MLKASAVQGCLDGTNLRSLAWMIFLECIPLDKSNWCSSVQSNRIKYDNLKGKTFCDPRVQTNQDILDHPLAQNKEVCINKIKENYICSFIIFGSFNNLNVLELLE